MINNLRSFNRASRFVQGFLKGLMFSLPPLLQEKMHPHGKTQTLVGTKPLPKLLQTPILRRAAVLKQRTVHQWRRHRFLGRKHAKHAFLHTSLLCNYWLVCIAVLLCFLSATWGHTLAKTGISPTAIIAAILFPLDFVGLFIALLGILYPRNF